MQLCNLSRSERIDLEDRLNKNKCVESYKFIYEDTAIRINDKELFSMEVVEKYLDKLQVEDRIKCNKPICACGSELRVVEYRGYYETFKFLNCENEQCNYIDNAKVDDEERGAYA